MLADLTKYLLLYKKLCIPHVGSFEIVHQAPEYNVVDKQISAPQYSIRHFQDEKLSDHQLEFIAATSQTNKDTAQQQLASLGSRIRNLAEENAFTWNGIGTLRISAGSIHFVNQLPAIEGLATIPAHKVLRENVEHSRLVGDRQTSSVVTHNAGKKGWWALPLKWGWIILAVAVVVIFFILFKNHFSPAASGLKLKFF